MSHLVFPSVPVTLVKVADGASAFPVARVFCIGRNYDWHSTAARTGRAAPDSPVELPAWFMKPAQAVVPAEGALPYPSGTNAFCPEIEWVVAIGVGGRNIAPAHAHSHIWGYAVGLDMTRRDLQQQAKTVGGPWEPAKAFDDSAPCTPIVPVGKVGHPTQGTIWLSVNGQVRQHADIADLMCPVPDLIAMLSQSVTLLPGDLIFTGTPSGVSTVVPGDVLTAGIAGMGELTMTVGSKTVS